MPTLTFTGLLIFLTVCILIAGCILIREVVLGYRNEDDWQRHLDEATDACFKHERKVTFPLGMTCPRCASIMRFMREGDR